MNLKTAVARPQDSRSQVASALPRPSSPARPEPQGSDLARLSADTGGSIKLKVERHSQWALLSRAQSQLSNIQGLERSIIDSYRELLALSRELEQNGSNRSRLADSVEQLKARLSREGQLDNNLEPRQTPARASYVLDRLDLLKPRQQAEQLNVRLPDSGTVSLKFAAGSSGRENLAQLSERFGEHGLTVSTTNKGQLRLAGRQDLLSSPWLFRGEGVRVPAGNPVPIQLAREPDKLSELADAFRGEGLMQEKARIRELLSNLEQQRRDLENQRQQLLQQVAQIRMEKTRGADHQMEVSATVKETLVNGDFSLQLSTLLGQANVSRFSVVALLGR